MSKEVHTGGVAGRGFSRISFVACPTYINIAQTIDTLRAIAPSTFQNLKDKS